MALKVKHKSYQDEQAIIDAAGEYIYGQPLPSAEDVEEIVIGSAISHASEFVKIKGFLKPDHFSKDIHRDIWTACMALDKKGDGVDLLTVTQALKSTRTTVIIDKKKTKITLLDKVGGPHFLVKIGDKAGLSLNTEYHARILVQKFIAREAIQLSFKYISQFYEDNGGAEVFNLRNQFSKKLQVWDDKTFFLGKTANEWINDASNDPDMFDMFGQLWKYQQLVFLFGETGTGKSILTVQIAEAIASGKAVMPGILNNECVPQVVLLFDFELSKKQFQKRYTRDDKPEEQYVFHENLKRFSINPEYLEYDQRMDEVIIQEIENQVIQYKAEVVIIDNITYVSGESTHDTAVAIQIMKKLKSLKIRYKLSMLVLAHTPKRNKAMPLTNDDMGGSKNLPNFADSVFAIGTDATDPTIKYIKQTKVRDGIELYNSDNVIRCAIQKDMDHFTKFSFMNMGKEMDHLMSWMNDDLEEAMLLEAVELHVKGKSYREISQHFGGKWAHMTVKRKVDKYMKERYIGG